MRYFEQRKARIEIIPMIDIMLFLFVFFVMISLHMIPASGVATQLPSSQTAHPLHHPEVVISLHQDGAIEVHNKALSLKQLRALLSRRDPAKTQVTVAAAKNTPVQRLLDVMSACRQAGITSIGIAARHARTHDAG